MVGAAFFVFESWLLIESERNRVVLRYSLCVEGLIRQNDSQAF
jgi:hypothetical protein